MKRLIVATTLIAALGAGFSAAADPDTFGSRIDGLARGWAHANFEIRDPGTRAADAAGVAARAEALARQYPDRAEPLVWEAIATATEAGAKGGIGGLALAKSARDLLERAEKLDPGALGDGSVYSSLGSLYAQVPGFPIGFGDPKRARSYLLKALAANPNGIDPNFFYGDFLMRQGDYAGAVHALEHALAAAPRSGREVADRGRRADANALLAEAKRKLHG